MNAGANIGSLKCLPRAPYGVLASRALVKTLKLRFRLPWDVCSPKAA